MVSGERRGERFEAEVICYISACPPNKFSTGLPNVYISSKKAYPNRGASQMYKKPKASLFGILATKFWSWGAVTIVPADMVTQKTATKRDVACVCRRLKRRCTWFRSSRTC